MDISTVAFHSASWPSWPPTAKPYQSGRDGPSGADVMGRHVRSLSISQIYLGECQRDSVSHAANAQQQIIQRGLATCRFGESAGIGGVAQRLTQAHVLGRVETHIGVV